jgi:hypothetical protein
MSFFVHEKTLSLNLPRTRRSNPADDRKRRLLTHHGHGHGSLSLRRIRQPVDHIIDADLEEHFKKKFWPTQLRSIRSQITKSEHSRRQVRRVSGAHLFVVYYCST